MSGGKRRAKEEIGDVEWDGGDRDDAVEEQRRRCWCDDGSL